MSDPTRTWEDRDNATNQAEAVAALADFFSSDTGIATAVGKTSSYRYKPKRVVLAIRDGESRQALSLLQ